MDGSLIYIIVIIFTYQELLFPNSREEMSLLIRYRINRYLIEMKKDRSTQTLPVGDGTLVEGSKDIVFVGVVLVIVVGKNNDNGRRDF